MSKNKVIIWGHKLHSHTHSYIHSAYYKAFKYLGYETYWFDSTDDVSNFDFSNCIFFTEGQVIKNMPIRRDCKYITHHVEKNFLVKNGANESNILQLGNYIKEVERFEKIDDLCYWDSSTNTLYQCWATDLLPDEIGDPIKFDENINHINYVGTLYGTIIPNINKFCMKAKQNGKICTLQGLSVSHEENKKLIQDSYICVDFRDQHHLNVGYIPCRIWKNISYGKITGTNSKYVKEALGNYVVYSDNPEILYDKLVDANKNSLVNMNDAMNHVRTKHTFVNRIKNLEMFL